MTNEMIKKRYGRVGKVSKITFKIRGVDNFTEAFMSVYNKLAQEGGEKYFKTRSDYEETE